MDTAIIVFAAVTLIIGLVCGLAPIFSGIKDDKDRLKQLTGIAAGIISFVPYLGSLGGLIVCVGLACLQFDEVWRIGVIAGIFVVGQVAEGMF